MKDSLRDLETAFLDQPFAVITSGSDGHVRDANQRFLNCVGLARRDLVGKPISQLANLKPHANGDARDLHAHDLHAQDLNACDWDAVRDGRCVEATATWQSASGSQIELTSRFLRFADVTGEIGLIVQIADARDGQQVDVDADCDETANMEVAMVDPDIQKADYIDLQWQMAAVHKSNCVVTFDMYGTVLDANDLFLQAMGYELDEIRGHHHKHLVEPAYAHSAEYFEFWNDLRAGKFRSGRFRRVGKDGRHVWFQASYNPIFDIHGEPQKIIKLATDVTSECMLQSDYQGQIAAIDNAQCVVSYDPEGIILDANENFLTTMGYNFADIRGRHHDLFQDGATASEEGCAADATFWPRLAAGEYERGEYKKTSRDGRDVWFQSTYNPIRDLDGKVIKIVEYAIDITETKQLRTDYQCQVQAISRSQDVAVFALDGTILDANENFIKTFGFERDELIGQHHSMLTSVDLRKSEEYKEFWQKLRSGGYHSGLFSRVGKDGREIWIQASYNPILDLNNKPVKVIKYSTDVSANVALAEAYKEARREAQHDAATSLPNRSKLSSFMTTWLANPAATMTVFYIDIDHFKEINDRYGQHVGDGVLSGLADMLRRIIRPEQLVARVGGDEFVIAAPGLDLDAAERICQLLYDEIAKPLRCDDFDIPISVSVGIAMSPGDGDTPDELLRCADAALYRSKQNGRGAYSYYSDDTNEKISDQKQLVEDFRNALKNGEFFLEYQPRFDTRSRTARSAEALVRWAHPERGRISPADFIPIAERSGLIVPLGDWIMQTACNAAARWNGIGVSVNLSPIQFRDPTLIEKVGEALKSSGLAPGLLELEITEGVLMDDAERMRDQLDRLKALGVRLAMDDFGTGYSSMNYLRQFPFDVIKIDQSFIRGLGTVDGARAIVQAIIGLARALGMSVTAEGVETNDQLLLLSADHCDELQGYLLARPLSLEAVDALLIETDHPPAALQA